MMILLWNATTTVHLCVPPKVASSTVKTWLVSARAPARSTRVRDAHFASQEELRLRRMAYDPSTAPRRAKQVRIALLREPVQRFVSAVYNKIVCSARRDPPVSRWLVSRMGTACLDEANMTDFVSMLERGGPVDVHFQPQSRLCTGSFDHTFHYEDMHRRQDEFRGLLSLPPLDIPFRPTQDHHPAWLTDALRARVQRIYEEDGRWWRKTLGVRPPHVARPRHAWAPFLGS